MRNRIFTRLFFSIAVLTSIFGCQVHLQNELQSTLSQQTEISKSSHQNNKTLPPYTATSKVTLSPQKSPTSKEIIPYNPTQVYQEFSRNLNISNQCNTACFLGIIPGITTLDETERIFYKYGLDVKFTVTEEQKDYYSVRYKYLDDLEISLSLTVKNGIVETLVTRLEVDTSSGSYSNKDWLAFSPNTLITEFGDPSRVELSLPMGPGSPSDGNNLPISCEIVLFFDRVDLVVKYFSPKFTHHGNEIDICPLDDELEGVNIWMGDKLFNTPSKNGKSFEEVTGQNSSQFSDIMLNKHTKIACFTIDQGSFYGK